MTASERDLRLLRRRLKAAKRRAMYWSGRPSFTGFGFVPGGNWRGKPLISRRRKRSIISMSNAGVTIKTISKKTGVSKTHVARIITKGLA